MRSLVGLLTDYRKHALSHAASERCEVTCKIKETHIRSVNSFLFFLFWCYAPSYIKASSEHLSCTKCLLREAEIDLGRKVHRTAHKM
jgi:hypothetical protein